MKRQNSTVLNFVAEYWLILAIPIGFVALAAYYSVITPIFEAPDEPSHYFYVKHLADTATLPVVTLESEELWAGEGHQPPLYYALGALLTSWIDTSDAEQLIKFNPHANIGRPLAQGNKNVLIHSNKENWPYQGTTLAIHVCRLFSVFLGAITVFVTFLTGLELFPKRRSIALGACLLVAFNPQFLFISGAVNNDSLVTTLSCLSVYTCIRLIKRGPSIVGSLVLGLLLGLAQLSKLNSLTLWPLGLLTVVLTHVKYRRSPKDTIESALMIFLPAIAIGGWWFARNWFLYRNLTGLNVHLSLQGRRTKPLTLARALYGARGLKMSYWAVFGWFNIVAEDFVYSLFDIISLAALFGMLLAPTKYLKERRATNFEPLVVLLAWVGMIGVSLLWWNMQTGGFQGRLLFPAISAISVLLSWGLSQLLLPQYFPLLISALGAAMLAIATITPFRYIGPAYARPPFLSIGEVQNILHDELNVTFGRCIKLLGYRTDGTIVQSGEDLTVTLYWQSLCPVDTDYSVFVHLLDDFESVIAGVDTYPGLGSYPTSQWQPGYVIADSYTLDVPGKVIASNSARLEVGLFDSDTETRLLAYSVSGDLIGDQLRFSSLVIESEAERPRPVGVFFDFGGILALAAYDLDQVVVSPGQEIELTLYWRMLAETEEDYWVLIRLVNQAGQVLLEDTSRLQFNHLPTSGLSIGQLIEDKHVLAIPPKLTDSGIYELQLSIYSPATGERLTIARQAGEPGSMDFSLLRIRIAK
jgi:4-amino-4-deoxy-L-arabinose transferase-like glycosyltransferase